MTQVTPNFSIFENLLDGFVRTDDQGIVLDWNLQAEKILGWAKSEAIGKPIVELVIPNERRAQHGPRIKKLLSTGQSEFLNQRIHVNTRHRNGNDVRIELSLFPIKNDTQTQYGACIRDITDFALAVEKLRASEEQYRSLVENAPDIILTIDREFKITFINRMAPSYQREQVIGKSAMLFIPEYDHERIKAIYQSILDTHLPRTFETEGIHSDGSKVWYDTSASPIFSGSEVVGITILTRDVSAMKQAQEDLKKHHEQLIISAKLSSLGEMAAGIAHEINNPLAIIYGTASQAKRKFDNGTLEKERLAENLSTIITTTERIAKIVKGLRTFSRESVGDPMTTNYLWQIIEDTLELCKEKFRFHSIDLEVICEQDIKIDCRPSQISQVIMNLLSNAYDAVEQLTSRWIKVIAEKKAGFVELSVTDSGNGIPPEIVAKIMQPFFTTKSIGKGTGLGLSISTGIAESHGGKLSYDKDGPNTRFILVLPMSPN